MAMAISFYVLGHRAVFDIVVEKPSFSLVDAAQIDHHLQTACHVDVLPLPVAPDALPRPPSSTAQRAAKRTLGGQAPGPARFVAENDTSASSAAAAAFLSDDEDAEPTQAAAAQPAQGAPAIAATIKHVARWVGMRPSPLLI